MKAESHSKPSLYPALFMTEHINISTGRAPGFFELGSLPYVLWKGSPNSSLISSSLKASFLSILLQKMTNGTFCSSCICNKESNSFFDSYSLSLSAASTM